LFTHRRILGRENTLSTQLLEILDIGQLAHSASLYGLVSMIVAPCPSSIPAACPSSHARAFISARARRTSASDFSTASLTTTPNRTAIRATSRLLASAISFSFGV